MLDSKDYPFAELVALFVQTDYRGGYLLEGDGTPEDPLAACIAQRRLYDEMVAAAKKKLGTGGRAAPPAISDLARARLASVSGVERCLPNFSSGLMARAFLSEIRPFPDCAGARPARQDCRGWQARRDHPPNSLSRHQRGLEEVSSRPARS